MQFELEFKKAATEISEKKMNVFFGSVDATIEEELANEYGVQGFPTVILFIDGERIVYKKDRISTEIVKWLEKKIFVSSIGIIENIQLERIIKENEVTVAYFGEDENEFEQFNKISKHFDEVVFVHSFEKSIKDYYQATKITLFTNGNESPIKYMESQLTLENLQQFILKNSYPKILNFDEKASEEIFGEGKDCLILFIDPNYHQKQLKQLEKASDDLQGKILMAKNEFSSSLQVKLAEFIGAPKIRLPMLILVNTKSPTLKKYLLDKEITSENIIEFYQNFISGNLITYKKSEEISQNNVGMIRKVVGKNFNEIVLNSNKDVLVKFYAPWCGHSKALAPIYAQVAEMLYQNDELIIAEYDAIANENEEVEIDGYPLIQLFPANDKEKPIPYYGGHSVNEIIKFVKENSAGIIVELNGEL